MYISNNVADRIKSLAKSQNISMKKLLEDVGLGFNTMSNMKTSMPKADNLAKIADYLDCSVDYLLGRTDNPNSHKDLQKGGAKMEKEMCNLSVTAKNGYIHIIQKYNMGEEDVVNFHPEQADLLIKWILEAKKELEEL
jgi:transcriptional regulator with XRE-family HTH domain